MLLGIGDIRQVAPVIGVGGRRETIDTSIVFCPLWPSSLLLRLYTPICNSSNPDYSQWIENIGHCTVGIDNADISLNMIAYHDHISNTITFNYLSKTLAHSEWFIFNCFPSLLNFWIDIFNESILNRQSHNTWSSTSPLITIYSAYFLQLHITVSIQSKRKKEVCQSNILHLQTTILLFKEKTEFLLTNSSHNNIAHVPSWGILTYRRVWLKIDQYC